MDSKFNMVNGMGMRVTTGTRGLALFVLGLGVLLSGCMQQTIEPASDANLTPRDRKLLANPPYAQASIPEPYQRHIVDFHRRESPGTIVVDPDARYLYYVLDKGKVYFELDVSAKPNDSASTRCGAPSSGPATPSPLSRTSPRARRRSDWARASRSSAPARRRCSP
jgi:lipoprotein-anchoring transpeptidase ErfK/SrfK